MHMKENCHFLAKNNGFQVIGGYGDLEWLKIFSKVKTFTIKPKYYDLN